MKREILLITISMVLISLNTSVFQTHALSAISQTQANGGPGGNNTPGRVNCTGPLSCTWNSFGGPGGKAISIPLTPIFNQSSLDVVTLPPEAPVSLDAISTHIIEIPNDDTSRLRLAVTNTGNAVCNLNVNVFPGPQSSPGINGLTPSTAGPNIPQPIGIVGHSTFNLGEIPEGGIKEFDVNVFPAHNVAGTVILPVQLTYNNPPQPQHPYPNPVGTWHGCYKITLGKNTGTIETANTPYSTLYKQVTVDVIPHR